MEYKTITLDTKNGIAFLTFNRPQALNAFNGEMVKEIIDAIRRIAVDDITRVLIVTGSGKSFSAGIDVRQELAKAAQGETPEVSERDISAMIVELWKLDKPVIAAVNGVAAGAGVSIALTCDMRIASEKGQFSMAFINRGLIPDCGGTFFLPKLVGNAKACELIFSGDTIDAKEAERLGLVNKVVPDEELIVVTEELGNKFSSLPPVALKYAKRAIHRGLVEPDLTAQFDYEIAVNRLCAQTEDFKEAVKAFQEKRKPIFKGK